MLLWKKKSGIIFVSSILGTFPVPGFQIYSSVKNLISNFGLAIGFEINDKIDTLVFECGETSTKLRNREPSFSVLTP